MDLLYSAQNRIRESLVGIFADYSANPDIAFFLWVVPLGILFGAVHALTPGHSKMVIASYVLGSRLSVSRSLTVSGVLAFVHVASAVVLALAAATLVKRTLGGAGRAPALEIASGALLLGLGLWLLWRGIRQREHVHNEGLLVGVAAGLIPCPLTLFTMVLALSRGVPEAGVAFAAMMMIGIAFTLSLVAMATALARDAMTAFLLEHRASATRLLGGLDILTGGLLTVAGFYRLLAS
jgi:nickel/cobalt transporter (NicO) family protein